MTATRKEVKATWEVMQTLRERISSFYDLQSVQITGLEYEPETKNLYFGAIFEDGSQEESRIYIGDLMI